MRNWVVSAAAACAALVSSAPAMAATPFYTITDLGSLTIGAGPGSAITDSTAVGTSFDAARIIGHGIVDGRQESILWTRGPGGYTATILPRAYPDTQPARTEAISSNGQYIVGYEGPSQYVSWDNGVATQREDWIYDVNSSGQIAGYRQSSGGYTATIFNQDGSFTQLTGMPKTSLGLELNDNGVLAGNWQDSTTGGAFIWSPTDGLTLLSGVTEMAGVRAISNTALVGTRIVSGGLVYGVYYDLATGERFETGALEPGESTILLGVNDLGWASGYSTLASGINHGVLWSGGNLYDLNNYIDPSLGFVISGASTVTNNGAIVGTARVNGVAHAVLLTPTDTDRGAPRFPSLLAVPEPGTWAMMIGGLGLIGGGMRRRRVAALA